MDVPTKAEVKADVNLLWAKKPPSPTREKPIEVMVVGRRCVYLNNYRIAGGKPYVSEHLPSHELTTSLRDVIDAFKEEDILAALAERQAEREYFKAYHAQPEELDA